MKVHVQPLGTMKVHVQLVGTMLSSVLLLPPSVEAEAC